MDFGAARACSRGGACGPRTNSPPLSRKAAPRTAQTLSSEFENRIAGKFGREYNLAVCRSPTATPNFISTKLISTISARKNYVMKFCFALTNRQIKIPPIFNFSGWRPNCQILFPPNFPVLRYGKLIMGRDKRSKEAEQRKESQNTHVCTQTQTHTQANQQGQPVSQNLVPITECLVLH